jgi:putative redox protein
MKNKVDVNWTQDMSFEATVENYKIIMDAAKEVGGKGRGPRPKPLALVSLGGCTGMDVVSILTKMRVDIENLNIEVEGELTDEHPKYYHSILITYKFKGKDLPLDKLEKAVNLSQERYCGITAMFGKAAKIDHKIVVES